MFNSSVTFAATALDVLAARSYSARSSASSIPPLAPPKQYVPVRRCWSTGRLRIAVGRSRQGPAQARLGVDIENDFAARVRGHRGQEEGPRRDQGRRRSKARRVLLAPDPDREGEAIAWHIAEEMRAVEPEHPARAVQRDHQEGGHRGDRAARCELDVKKFEAQQARRILDRLVGYEISPLLWNKVRRGLSAGRVQSVAVRLVVEREAEIKAFVPEEYWTVDATGRGARARRRSRPRWSSSTARRSSWSTTGQARERSSTMRQERRSSSSPSVERKERRKNAAAAVHHLEAAAGGVAQAPLLAQADDGARAAAVRRRRARRRGPGRPHHLHAYRLDAHLRRRARPRCAATSPDATAQTFLPEEPNVYKTKKSAQDAHEAIRPTSIEYDPETVRSLLTAAAASATSARPRTCSSSTR